MFSSINYSLFRQLFLEILSKPALPAGSCAITVELCELAVLFKKNGRVALDWLALDLLGIRIDLHHLQENCLAADCR